MLNTRELETFFQLSFHVLGGGPGRLAGPKMLQTTSLITFNKREEEFGDEDKGKERHNGCALSPWQRGIPAVFALHQTLLRTRNKRRGQTSALAVVDLLLALILPAKNKELSHLGLSLGDEDETSILPSRRMSYGRK